MKRADEYDVFLSYAHADAELVAALDVALASAGLRVFLDRRDIRAGDRLVDSVFDGIAAAKAQIGASVGAWGSCGIRLSGKMAVSRAGFRLSKRWLDATAASVDDAKVTVLRWWSQGSLENLEKRDILAWRRVTSDHAERAGRIGADGELRDWVRRVSEACQQLMLDVVRFSVPHAGDGKEQA